MKQPLKLMPLEAFGKLVARIAQVPKSAVSPRDSTKSRAQKQDELKKVVQQIVTPQIAEPKNMRPKKPTPPSQP